MIVFTSSRIRSPRLLPLLLAACAGLSACRKAAAPEAEKKVAPLAAEVERLQFALPADFTQVELRGEGSETLRAPAGAAVRSLPGRAEVVAGADFALEVDLQPRQPELPEPPVGARRVMRESDLVVFESAGSYSFVVLRELVPEWDESERRRIVCSSAGATRIGSTTEPRGFPRAAVERMVAACRSLALPRLE
jgi:hypothetical protein